MGVVQLVNAPAVMPDGDSPTTPYWSNNMVAVFTYGTLQVPEIFEAVTGTTAVSKRAVLPDYARYGIRGQVFPGIIPEHGASVIGRYYFDIDEQSLASIDEFEDMLYDRRTVYVNVGGKKRPAETYIITARFRDWLDGRPWRLDTFRDRHLARYLNRCRRFSRESGSDNQPA